MRILLVGDDSTVFDSLVLALKGQGILYEAHASPVSAAFAAAFAPTPFDAVIATQGASGMDDAEILHVMELFSPGAVVFLVAPSARRSPGYAFARERSNDEAKKAGHVVRVEEAMSAIQALQSAAA